MAEINNAWAEIMARIGIEDWPDDSSSEDEDEVVVDDDIEEDESDHGWNDYDSEKEKEDASVDSDDSYNCEDFNLAVKKGSRVRSDQEGDLMSLPELSQNPHFKYARFNGPYFNTRRAKEAASFFTSDTRIWKELAFCLCEGNLDIVLQTALLLNRVESLFLLYQDDEEHNPDDEDESIVEVLPVRGMGTLLKLNTSLTNLQIRAATMDAADAESLSSGLQWNKTLKKIHLCCLLEDDDVVSELAQGLKKNKSIESVVLDGGPDYSDLIRALRGKTNLRELSIRTQDLVYEAHALTGLLRSETTKLDSLHLEGILPQQCELPEYLFEAMKKHQSITSLKLVNLNITCANHNHWLGENRRLGDRNLQNLQDLTLAGCHFGEEGGTFVALVLSRNPMLKKLSIHRIETGLRLRGIRELASALGNHLSLQVLNLRDNGITDANFELLAPVLLAHPTLKDLDLSKNNISQTAVVAKIISNNSVLQKLKVLDNEIDVHNFASIALALGSNSTLKVMALNRTRLTADHGLVSAESGEIQAELETELEIVELELEILKYNSQLEHLNLTDADVESLDSSLEMKRKMIYLCNLNRGGRRILQDRSFSLALWPLVLERADTIGYYEAYDDATVKATNETSQASILFSLLREASTQLFSHCHRRTDPGPRRGRSKRRRSD
jgi:hypothetical protein